MNNYWTQWPSSEINSMHGYSDDDYKDHEETDFYRDLPTDCPCGNICLRCLGMSQSDFI